MSKAWRSKEAIRKRVARNVLRTQKWFDACKPETLGDGQLIEAASLLAKQSSDLTKTRDMLERVKVSASLQGGDNTKYYATPNQRDIGMYTDNYKEYSAPPPGGHDKLDPLFHNYYDHRARLVNIAALAMLEAERLDLLAYDLNDYGFNMLDEEALHDSKVRDKLINKRRKSDYQISEIAVDSATPVTYTNGSQATPTSQNNVTASP